MADTVETAIYRLQVEGQEKIDQLKASLDGLTVSEEKATNGTRTTSQALQNRLARMDPLIKAQQQYTKELESAQRYAQAGVGTDAQRNAQIELATQRYNAQVSAIKKVEDATKSGTAATGLARFELVNLSRQAQDIFVGLTSGQSFGTVLVQQGTQVADVFANSTGTIKGFFGQVASGAASLLTPMRLATAGAVGLAAAGLYLGYNWSESQAQVNRAVIGIGAATGSTASDLSNFAKANSSATGLTIAEARDVAIEFTKTGDIAVKNLKGVGDAVHGYAVLTGKDATDATKDLANALSGDLVKGAEELNKTYMAFDAPALQYIQTLQTTGEKARAVQFIVDSIAPANQKAADSVGFLTKAYQALAGAMSLIKNGPSTTAAATAEVSPQERLQRAKTVQESAGTSFSDQLAAGLGSGILPNLKNIDDAVKTAQEDVDNFGSIGKEAFVKLSTEAKAATGAIFPQIEQIRQLEIQLDKLQEAKAKGAADPNVDASITAYQNQIAGLKESVATADAYNVRVKQISESWGNVDQQTALALQAAQNQLPVLQAVGGAAKIAAQATADYKNLMDQGKTSTEAAALAASNQAAALAQVNSNAQQTLASLRDQYAVASAYTVQQQITAQGQATFNQLVREGVDAVTAESVATQQVANARAQVYEQMEKAVQASRDQVALAQTAGTADQIGVKAAIARRQALDAGADSTQAAIIANNAGAVAAAQWADQAQRMAQAYEDAERAASKGSFDFSPDPKLTEKTGATVETIPYWIKQRLQDASVAPPDVLGRINLSLGNGKGIDATLTSIKGLKAGTTTNNPGAAIEPFLGFEAGQLGLSKSTTISDQDIISQVQALYELKNSQTTDDAVKKANLQEELAWLQSRPETLARDQAIAQLIQAINNNTDATSANTVSLNPLYNGRDALKIGYYKAASGLDLIAQGPTSGDQVPFHAMINGGERVKIMTAAEQAAMTSNNDNRRNTTINISLPPAKNSSARRVQRQYAQGFGQAMAALG
ncbi:phage tail length tape measure family protein [Bradyrhizobium sp. USDA 4545]|uniref:phage tail length tape measure family protein n=1 Tax=Bradyrhizobium sp. USDA 4545 TaxID=2817705 RepID=UPI0020A2F99A|nr:phage tail length tape measure family protein [Bradyrhizobium sp. USDA 4545]MCP1832839.1 hypothetical protein [Bradyrhizobium sp. USDA 4545]